jgi:hypothetical protein
MRRVGRAQVKKQSGTTENSLLRAFARGMAPAGLAIFLLAGIAASAFVQRAGFNSLTEVGFGDSYILYDVMNFEKTGIIYRDLSGPPYLPAQYSPSLYMTYSLSRFSPFANIFLGPRLIAFATFLLCAGMAVSIVRKLIPLRLAWLWGVLIVVSIRSTDVWVLQLRGDFLGIFFGLAAIRLLMSRHRNVALAAGLCAGMAVQVKLTLLAAAAAGFLWLLMRRRWKDAGLFTLGATTTTVGLFFLYWLREPGMIHQMTALIPGIKDVGGDVDHLTVALLEPVTLLALVAGVPLVASHIWPPSSQWSNWTLLLMYAAAAAALGFLTDLHVGGNINYFFEFLYALTPFAVLGAFRLFCWSNRRPWTAFSVVSVLVIYFLLFNVKFMSALWAEDNPGTVRDNNRQFSNLEGALRAHHIFSIDPRVALIDPHPALMEPFLFTYSQRMGRFDAAPLVKRIIAVEFDAVVSSLRVKVYRGVRYDGAELENAISTAYQPYCTALGDVIQLPRSRPANAEFQDELRAAGCAVLSGQNAQP